MPNFSLNGFAFYDAPKNGGTTVRMWLKHAEGALPADFATEGYYTLASVGVPRQWVDTTMVAAPGFAPGPAEDRRWCIVRDPVERFLSAYTDKILHERLVAWGLDQCIALLETGEMRALALAPEPTDQKRAAYHFLPQTFWFGTDRNRFDRVFPLSDMEAVRRFCETEVFRQPLPPLHGRNQAFSGHAVPVPSRRQRQRIEAVYQADYEAGWLPGPCHEQAAE